MNRQKALLSAQAPILVELKGCKEEEARRGRGRVGHSQRRPNANAKHTNKRGAVPTHTHTHTHTHTRTHAGTHTTSTSTSTHAHENPHTSSEGGGRVQAHLRDPAGPGQWSTIRGAVGGVRESELRRRSASADGYQRAPAVTLREGGARTALMWLLHCSHRRNRRRREMGGRAHGPQPGAVPATRDSALTAGIRRTRV